MLDIYTDILVDALSWLEGVLSEGDAEVNLYSLGFEAFKAN